MKSTKPSDPQRSKLATNRRRLLLLLGGGAAGIGGTAAVIFRSPPADASKRVTLYKNPECECCEGYADYLRGNGFAVNVIPTNDLTLMGEKYGIPDDLQPCHLSMVNGYVIGGHVPIAPINRLLAQKPAITGINLPGMPTGTPGMGGPKTAPLTIYEIGKDPRKVYAVV